MLKFEIEGEQREVHVGQIVEFGYMIDGDRDWGLEEKLLESGAISPDNESVISFDVIERKENILESIVKVTAI